MESSGHFGPISMSLGSRKEVEKGWRGKKIARPTVDVSTVLAATLRLRSAPSSVECDDAHVLFISDIIAGTRLARLHARL